MVAFRISTRCSPVPQAVQYFSLPTFWISRDTNCHICINPFSQVGLQTSSGVVAPLQLVFMFFGSVECMEWVALGGLR